MGFHWLWMWISSLPSHQRHCLKHHNNNNIKTFKPQKETVEHCGSVSREVNALSWAEISSGENLVIPIRGCFLVFVLVEELPVCFYKSRFFVTEKRDSYFIVMLCAFLDFSADDDSRYLFVIEPWKAQRGMDLAHCFRSCASEKMLRCFTGEGQTFDDLNRRMKWGRAGKKQDWSGWSGGTVTEVDAEEWRLEMELMPFHIPRWGLAVTSSPLVPDLASAFTHSFMDVTKHFPVWDSVYQYYCWYINSSWHSDGSRAKYNLSPTQTS